MNEELLSQTLNEINNEQKCLRIILVGDGTELGLVGKIALINTQISNIQTLVENDLAHITARMDMEFRKRDAVDETKEALRTKLDYAESELIKKLEKEKKENAVMWKEVLFQWLKPVLVGLVTALVIYFLTK